MLNTSPAPAIAYEALGEAELVRLAKEGHRSAFGVLIQRCNQRLFRVARSIVRDDGDAEDVLQEAYTRGFHRFDTFRGEASVLTWLTRITVNEARGRLRRRRVTVGLEQVDAAQESVQVNLFAGAHSPETPEAHAARTQTGRLIEAAVDRLPAAFRIVFVMRDVDGCSVDETAQRLKLCPATVRTRLHRARRLLRAHLDETACRIDEAFPFLGVRCQRITGKVLSLLAPHYGWSS
jgi:RNA polymerase sigma-70 factor (ECF subfamily)